MDLVLNVFSNKKHICVKKKHKTLSYWNKILSVSLPSAILIELIEGPALVLF